MAEFYYNSELGFVAVFPDGKLNNGIFFLEITDYMG